MSKKLDPDDLFIDIAGAPSRGLSVISIPYGDYKVKITVRSNGRSITEEDILVFKQNAITENRWDNVTETLVTQFNKNQRIRPTGPNLMRIMALIFNLCDED